MLIVWKTLAYVSRFKSLLACQSVEVVLHVYWIRAKGTLGKNTGGDLKELLNRAQSELAETLLSFLDWLFMQLRRSS